MDRFANSLFHLIANLSQKRNSENIINQLIDGLNSLLPDASFKWEEHTETENSITIATRKNCFGYIKYSKVFNYSEHHLALIQNAAQMLAVIFERLLQENMLQDNKYRLENLVEQRTEELLKQNLDYESLNEEYMAQNEELSKANNNLKENEERLRFLFENMIQGVVYHNITGEITYANKAAANILGLTIDQLKGKTSLDSRWKSIREDGSDYPGNEHPAMLTFRTGKPVENQKMGVYNPGENSYRWININSIPKFKGNEKIPYQVVVTFEDITEIIKAKKEIEEAKVKAEVNEKQFRQLFENMEQGFALHEMIYDKKGNPVDYRFVLMNKAFEKLTTMAASEFVGRTVKDFLPNIEQVWIENYGKVASTGIPLQFENYSQDLNKYYDVIAYSPAKGYFATVFTDITEKKYHAIELEKHRNHLKLLVKERTDELETSNEELMAANEELYSQKKTLENTLTKLSDAHAKLVQSEKMASLGILVAGVAHEINNPINFINSSISGLKNNLQYLSEFIQLYKKLEKNPDKIIKEINKKEETIGISEVMAMLVRSIEIIEVGIERTTKIVKGLKTFARSDEKELSRYNVHENLDNTLLILYNQYKNRIEIKKDFTRIPLIECFAGQINQVLMNLLTNAIQSIEDKGTITISTKLEKDEMISIKIADTGSGIPQKYLSQIFDPFFTTKEVGKGTGLGLSISYGIINEHHGELLVESEQGEGSCFTIILPIKQNSV